MQDQVEIVRDVMRVRSSPADGPRVWLDLMTFTQPLLMAASIDSMEQFDRSLSTNWCGLQQRPDCERLTWTAESTLWSKRYHLDVHSDHLEFHAELTGHHSVDAIRFFDSIEDAGFREHSVLTKHFNDKGHTRARAYSTGSPVAFKHVFCPEPNSYARQVVRSYEYAQISVNADLDYCGGNFTANPGLLCFAVSAEPDREWLAFGLAVERGEYLFSEYEYLGGEDFALNLNSWGGRQIDGTFCTPRVVIVPGSTPERALTRYVDVLNESGRNLPTQRTRPEWWSRPIVCGWGQQCYQADLFRIRSSPERPPDNAAYILSTQANYRDMTEYLDVRGVPWGTLVIDARWFQTGGLKNVDEGRWPNLRGFIDGNHRRDRRTLLWWSPWDPEGIPADQCVRYQPPEQPQRQNRPGRLGKFGPPTPGKKLAIDITLPAVRDRVRAQVRKLLGSGPGECNADGLKIDHVAAAPGMYGMQFPDGSRRLYGIEAVREYLTLLYEAVKEVKPDALLIGQSPNPYLSDVQDMVRLGDIYSCDPSSVIAEMAFRRKMALIADGSWLVDTDGWPMPSLQALREYVDFQPSIGVPSLYYITHLDTTGEPLCGEDYARIRHAWRAR